MTRNEKEEKQKKIINKIKYQNQKEEARQKAIDWQIEFSQNDHFMSEYAYYNDYFYKLAKRYGLIKEFKEDGII